ncbi:MAG: type II toxin-antitoxin system RelE/ParE family toxin [Mariprofundaceae bacterium]|nr:type II toxin-antitoxin system RelE/ParE family toxin [Mariprofundaceae bacterium]
MIYTQQAVEDLQRLREFIAEKNPSSAQRIAGELRQRIHQLQQMPMMGRPVACAPDPQIIRDMVFGKYTVRYAIHGQTLAILKIWHHYEEHG